ncbi:MAG: HAD-IC family P-type ATPase [Lachnospiraceae bacterium]|nr:HAD-IC family P-type ATPase [Lachnospiraceae bacterium]
MVTGLTHSQVEKKVAEGKVNVTDQNAHSKSYKQILLSNTITFFNILNIIFFVMILSVGSYKNCLFMWVIIVNTVIGIIQEIRTKKTLDSLAILTASTVRVIRESQEVKIPVEGLVTDDIMVLSTGDEIPADAELIEGEIEVNESMLTGESDNVMKVPGDSIFSGAFVTSGQCIARVVHVGKDNYIETISGEAKKFKRVNSQLRKSLNNILKAVSFMIVPLCAGLFAKQYFLHHASFRSAVEQMVTSGIGMIPEGLVLLTSTALTMGVLRLAKKRTIVQELFCIETLARVDVLCLDKTGTLTEGRIVVEEVIPFEDEKEGFYEGFRNLLAGQKTKNATQEGLVEFFKTPETRWEVLYEIPFSSDRKYSGASFRGHGTYYMGAAQFLMPEDHELPRMLEPYLERGMRVLILAHSDINMTDNTLPADLRCLGFVAMSDVIRTNCNEAVQYFREQGVSLRVISGDDAVTVSKIAEKCGIDNADKYIDVSTLTDDELRQAMQDFYVFGRVRPDQKERMVEILQEMGHTVAMTGDGVNDVLALKKADCSIAMASGSEAAKHTANIVLLDSDFTSMPSVVNEGRRVINNICRASAMYLIKTTFSVLLTLGTLIVGHTYPFQAVQLSIISGCAVGIPTFFLQLEPSFDRIPKDFMSRVFKNALPAGITIALCTFLITNIGLSFNTELAGMLSTICVIMIGFIYFFMLKRIYSPLSPYRRIVIYTMEISYLVVMIIGQKILEFTDVTVTGVLILVGIITLAPILIDLLESFYSKYIARIVKVLSEPREEEDEDEGEKKVRAY